MWCKVQIISIQAVVITRIHSKITYNSKILTNNKVVSQHALTTKESVCQNAHNARNFMRVEFAMTKSTWQIETHLKLTKWTGIA